MMGLDLPPDRIPPLLAYLDELRKWNRKVNLIGPAEPPEQVVLHILDSLAPLPWLPEDPVSLLDLGSGGGLPGLVLALIRPNWQVTLAESRNRKAAFLRHAVRQLGLSKVTVFEGRVEAKSAAGLPGAPFGLVTARAFADMTTILAMTRPCLARGGQVLAYKGPSATEDLAESRAACPEADPTLLTMHEFRLPFIGHGRTLLFLSLD